MFDRLQFLLGEALIALRRNGWMTFAAISTVAISLFLIGGLGFTYLKLSEEAQAMTGKFELRVMLRDGTSTAEITKAAAQIRTIKGVKEVNWIPRDKAWKRYLDANPAQKQFADISNPYPDSFKVILSDLALSDDVVESIKKQPTVEDIQYLKEGQQFFSQLQAVVKWLATALGGLLFVTGGILIYNAIRLTIISRRLEIRIMQLVGASFLTIRIPFYIEGIVQGLVGGLVGSLILIACRSVLADRVQVMMNLQVPPIPMAIVGLLCLCGAAYGLLCSMIAVRAPLRYR